MNSSMSRWFLHAIKLASLVAMLCAIYCVWHVYQINKTTIKQAQTTAQNKTKKTTEYLDTFIQLLKTETNKLAQSLKTIPLEKETIEKALSQKPVTITGLGVILNPKKTVSGYYYFEDQDKQQHTRLTAQQLKTVQLPKNNGQFIGPVQDPVTGKPTILYTQVLPEQDALLFATQSLDHLNHILSTLHLGKNGYWIVTDQNGIIIRHPQKDVVAQQLTLPQLAEEKETSLNGASIEQPSGFTSFASDISNAPSWLVFEPISSVGWKLFGVFDIQQIPFDWSTLRHYWMLLVLFFTLSLCLALGTFLGRCRNWVIVGIISTILFIALTALWLIAAAFPHYNKGFIPIEDKIGLYSFLDAYTSNKKTVTPANDLDLSFEQLNYYLRYRYKSGKYIFTGIYIKELGFTSAETIEFVGYIWQRYFDGIHDRASRGFILPQIAKEPTITEISRIKEGKTETIIWQVSAKINQQLSYKRYPFDNKQLNIELRHKDFDKNIILVPDLDAYPTINPSALPGLSQTMYLSGWNPQKSSFEYHIEKYRTNFGLYAYGPFGIYKTTSHAQHPLLNFGTMIKRNLLESLITDLLPLLVVALLLFICFITDVQQGFGGFVPSLAGIFFGTILSHLSFRNKIPPHEIVYLETFYLILYVAMVIILILSMLNMFEIPIKWINYKNNRRAKLLYWPALLSSLLIVTVWYLY